MARSTAPRAGPTATDPAKGQALDQDRVLATALAAAQASIAAARWDEAIGELLDAIARLDSVNGVDVAPYRAAIGDVIKEVEEVWWSVLPDCPGTAPCKS